MTLMRTLPLALALAVGLGACAKIPTDQRASKESATSEEETLEAAQALVTKASNGVARAESVFEGLGGMVGVVVAPVNGQPGASRSVVWISPDKSVVFPGPAVDIEGVNVSERFAQEHSGQGSATTSTPTAAVDKSALLERAAATESGSFVQGRRGPVITAIVDLNCVHCNTLFSSAQPLIQEGKVRVRYVLAGFMSPTSVPKAAAVLGARDKVAALRKAEEDYSKNGPNGAAPKFDAKHEPTIAANTQLLQDTGEPATPYLFYCDKETQEVKGIAGAPQNLAGFIETVGSEGHAACGG